MDTVGCGWTMVMKGSHVGQLHFVIEVQAVAPGLKSGPKAGDVVSQSAFQCSRIAD